MRRPAIVALALVTACRGASRAPSPDAPRAVEDAARAPATPREALVAEGARALDAWKRHAAGVTDEARWRRIASFNHCEATEGGVWATLLDPPSGDAPRDHPEGRFKLVWMADAGARSEAYPSLVDDGETFTLRPGETNWADDETTATRMGAWTLFDYDGDHVAEVIVPLSRSVSERSEATYALVWKATASRVQPFEPAMGLHPVGTGDFDNDGRPDLVTHAGLVATYNNAAGVDDTLRGPGLAAVSRPGGVFLTSSGAALRHDRTLCPAPPATYFGASAAEAAKNVACAMLWRVPPAQIAAALRRECPPARTGDGPRPCLDLAPGLEAMTRVTPQADLRNAVSVRYEELPPSDPADAGSDAPRARYTLHVEGLGVAFEPTVNLGELTGTCSLEPGAGAVVAKLRCWWAGAGDEFQVLQRGPSIVVQRRGVDEQAPPTRWTDVGRANVPAGAVLRAGDID